MFRCGRPCCWWRSAQCLTKQSHVAAVETCVECCVHKHIRRQQQAKQTHTARPGKTRHEMSLLVSHMQACASETSPGQARRGKPGLFCVCLCLCLLVGFAAALVLAACSLAGWLLAPETMMILSGPTPAAASALSSDSFSPPAFTTRSHPPHTDRPPISHHHYPATSKRRRTHLRIRPRRTLQIACSTATTTHQPTISHPKASSEVAHYQPTHTRSSKQSRVYVFVPRARLCTRSAA
jgi:hypothetical protein